MSDNNRMEIVWGVRMLDEGFTQIPNLLIRNYRKIGIEHGEWGFICAVLTHKHDHRDPYPSEETIAEHLDCSTRQIRKWVASLSKKRLIRHGQRQNQTSSKWSNNTYNFKPMLDAVLKLIGEKELPETVEDDFKIIWRDFEPEEPEVPTVLVPQVPTVLVPQVPTKRKDLKDNIKIDDDDRAAVPLVDINHYYSIYKFDSKTDFQKAFDEVKARVDVEYAKGTIGSYVDYFEKSFAKEVTKYEIRKGKKQAAATKALELKRSLRGKGVGNKPNLLIVGQQKEGDLQVEINDQEFDEKYANELIEAAERRNKERRDVERWQRTE